MSKLTPEQAWVHVKALWPNATCMEKFAMINNFSITSIDWPAGVDRYPPKEEWRDAVWPQDWGKPCRVYNYDLEQHEDAGVLIGRRKDGYFLVESNGIEIVGELQVRVTDDEPTIRKCRKVEQEKAAEDIFPPKDELKPGWLLPPGWLRKSKLSEQVAEWPEEVKSLMHINDGLVQKPDDGRQPMATAPKDREVELLMGGDWMDGFYNEGLWWTKTRYGRCTGWDRGHQPTAWREPKRDV